MVLNEYEALRGITDGLAERFADLFDRDIVPEAAGPAAVYEALRELAVSIVERSLRDSLHREGTKRITD